MKVDILASGSSGNCIVVQSGGTTILVDAGIAKTKIEKRLLEVGVKASEIDGIFITHAHSDHVKGLSIANKYKIPVFATIGEWEDIFQNVDHDLREISDPNGCLFDYEGIKDWMEIRPFNTYHDATEPVGYTITTSSKKCSVCLDTGKVDSEMIKAMKGSDCYIIEANHEHNLVELSKYPNSVKSRILSDFGHLSNQQTAEALMELIEGKDEQIYLMHLSSANNMPGLASNTVNLALSKKGFKLGEHYTLEVR